MDKTALLVVAMRIGDLYSGYTFSTRADFNDNPRNIACYGKWKSQYLDQLDLQTPTSILLNAERGFVSFGYEAEDNYLSLYEKKTESDVYFFQNFACPLKWYKETNGEIVIKPSNRIDSVPLKTLLGHSVSYLKAHLLNEIQNRMLFTEDVILWVVVYPDDIKFDIRFILLDAFRNTGITKENIVLVGENHAIQAFAHQIQQTTIYNVNGVSNDRTIILNCSLSQICPNVDLQKYPKVPTIVIGMSSVITDIESIMKRRLGCSMFTDLTDIHSKCDFIRNLDSTLQSSVLKEAHGSYVGIKVPQPLIKHLRKHVPSSSNDGFRFMVHVLQIETAVIHQVFQNALKPLMDHLRSKISILKREIVHRVILVGDFSRYIMTKVILQESFPQYEFIVPSNSQMAVQIGGTLTGHEIRTGKCDYCILYVPKMTCMLIPRLEPEALKLSYHLEKSLNENPNVKPCMDTDATLHNISNVSYLPDPIRPSKIATKLQDLYEIEYAEILEDIVKKGCDHDTSEGFLLQILHEAYDECRMQAHAQINTITQAFYPTNVIDVDTSLLPSDVVKPLIEYRRKNALKYLPRLIKSFVETFPNKINISNAQLSVCTPFIEKGMECCWLMSVTEPPMFLNFQWNKIEKIDLNELEIESGNGKYVDSMRWPALYLYENGPLMNKGVVNTK